MNKDVKAQRDDELFDIVDHLDRVVGQATRARVHACQLWHRAIHVLIFDRAGRVLLQKRSMLKDTAPGKWDSSCSGHLDAGEDYEPAARRELGEELGLVVDEAPEPWLRLEACKETGWEFVWVYRMRHAGPFKPHAIEIERVEWWDPVRVGRAIAVRPDDFAPAFRYIWEQVAAQLDPSGDEATD